MAFFGLFDKKTCAICGAEIGLLGNRKLEDGNCCKSCAAKLSPWFDERRHSTVEQIKEQLANMPDGKPGLVFFNTVKETTADLEDIQADEKNPSDCAKEPHEITHTVDMLRYYCVSRTMRAEAQAADDAVEDEDETEEDYDSYMTGGEVSAGYMAY